jgi:hypothetical protein
MVLLCERKWDPERNLSPGGEGINLSPPPTIAKKNFDARWKGPARWPGES